MLALLNFWEVVNMPQVGTYAPQSGRVIREDNSVVNKGDFYFDRRIRNSEIIIDAAATHAVKTVSTTAAELFAGASRKAGRKRMRVYNEGSVTIYFGIGDNTITAGSSGTGQPITPGDFEMFYFEPTVAIPVYFAASSANSNVKVSEL